MGFELGTSKIPQNTSIGMPTLPPKLSVDSLGSGFKAQLNENVTVFAKGGSTVGTFKPYAEAGVKFHDPGVSVSVHKGFVFSEFAIELLA